MHDSEFWNIFQQTRPLYLKQAAVSKSHTANWSMFQQTRPLYKQPLISPAPPPPPPVIEWPRKIYVATRAMGVYYTENFDGISQPVWMRVNDGLATLDCYEFHLDPFDNENCQFVLIQTGGILYRRRNQGNWEVVLDNTIRQALCGFQYTDYVGGFCFDPSIQGRVWMVTTKRPEYGQVECELAFCSDDYGDNWDVGWIYCGPYAGTGTIRAHGDRAWSSDGAGIGAYSYMLYTEDRNQHWTWQCVGLLGKPELEYNPLSPDFTNYSLPAYGNTLGYFRNAAYYGELIGDHTLCFDSSGDMWFSATNFNHQRIIRSGVLHYTYDNWATRVDNPAYATSLQGTIAPWAGDNEDHMLVETAGNHLVSGLHSEGDLIPNGISGAMPDVAPYIDSIPKGTVSGWTCLCGIQAVREAGVVYV